MNTIADFAAGDRYRGQSHYSASGQFGTRRDFDDLAECASVTPRLQADHEKDRAGATSGKTGANFGRNQRRDLLE